MFLVIFLFFTQKVHVDHIDQIIIKHLLSAGSDTKNTRKTTIYFILIIFINKLVKNELGVDDHFDTSAERERQKMVIWKHDLTDLTNKQIYSKIVGISFNNFSLSRDVIRFYAKCLD